MFIFKCIICYSYPGAVALPTSHYGEGNGSIFIDDLSCTGHEKNWWECSSYTANHNCRHFEDASVRCQPKGQEFLPPPPPPLSCTCTLFFSFPYYLLLLLLLIIFIFCYFLPISFLVSLPLPLYPAHFQHVSMVTLDWPTVLTS